MNPQLIEVKELAEEQITRGRESAEEVLGEDDDLVLRGRGHQFVPWGSSFDAGRKKTGQPVRLQLLRRDRGSAPIGGDRSLRDEDLAAAAASAAMSTVLLDEEALALEVPLVRLGAMAYVRSERGVLRAGKR